MRTVLALMVVAAVATTSCKRSDDDRKITAAPEQAAPSATVTAPVAPEPPPSEGIGPANPLAMPLKHDGPIPPAATATVDPCAPHEEKGGLAMRPRHDKTGPPQSNPLCMRLK